MPPYFEVNFQYSKKENAAKPVVEGFYMALLQCGLSFQSGYYEPEQVSLADIIRWNQKKLDENFQLGYTEHYSHGYKQALFDFCGFSEVRVFVHNYKECGSVFFCLIIPEDDFVTYDLAEGNDGYYHRCHVVEHSDKMSIIEELAIQMWEIGSMNSIQTGWELSGPPTPFDKILRGAQPHTEPFCIVPKDIVRSEWNCAAKAIGRRGALLKDENWFF